MYVDGDAYFEGTTFESDVNFHNGHFRTIFFGHPDIAKTTCSFQGSVDWRGCSYNRIHPVSSWKQLMDRQNPYDRQPYTQLEDVLRKTGYDQEAKEVYYRRKCVEAKKIRTFQRKPFKLYWRDIVSWTSDRSFWLLTGYGVRLTRILYATLIILAIGTFVFLHKGAVELRTENQPVAKAAASHMVVTPTLGFADAFWVSAHQLLPIEIPSGAKWEPTLNPIISRWSTVT